jgi:hypothetical protein
MQPPVGPDEDAMVTLLQLYCVVAFCISVVINVITNYKQLSCVFMSASVCVYEFRSFLALSFPIANLGIEDSLLASICNGRRLFSLLPILSFEPEHIEVLWCYFQPLLFPFYSVISPPTTLQFIFIQQLYLIPFIQKAVIMCEFCILFINFVVVVVVAFQFDIMQIFLKLQYKLTHKIACIQFIKTMSRRSGHAISFRLKCQSEGTHNLKKVGAPCFI